MKKSKGVSVFDWQATKESIFAEDREFNGCKPVTGTSKSMRDGSLVNPQDEKELYTKNNPSKFRITREPKPKL